MKIERVAMPVHHVVLEGVVSVEADLTDFAEVVEVGSSGTFDPVGFFRQIDRVQLGVRGSGVTNSTAEV